MRKTTVYALVDPHTHQVRYVGRTSKSVAARLREHCQLAENQPKNRHYLRPVYEWIRSLQPEQPVVIVLQEGIDVYQFSPGDRGYVNTGEQAETKWMKRFERSPLLCSVNRKSWSYRALRNPAK